MTPGLKRLWENLVWRPRPPRPSCGTCRYWRHDGLRVMCALSGRSVSHERRPPGWWACFRAGRCGALGRLHTLPDGYNLERERTACLGYLASFLGMPLFWWDHWWALALAIDFQVVTLAVVVWSLPALHRGALHREGRDE